MIKKEYDTVTFEIHRAGWLCRTKDDEELGIVSYSAIRRAFEFCAYKFKRLTVSNLTEIACFMEQLDMKQQAR